MLHFILKVQRCSGSEILSERVQFGGCGDEGCVLRGNPPEVRLSRQLQKGKFLNFCSANASEYFSGNITWKIYLPSEMTGLNLETE